MWSSFRRPTKRERELRAVGGPFQRDPVAALRSAPGSALSATQC